MASDQTQQIIQRLRLASATEQARAINRGDITSSELISAEADTIDKLNPSINAFLQRSGHPGKADCSSTMTVSDVTGALQGISFAVKENFDVAGYATQAGLAALSAKPAQKDSDAVARLKNAGLVFTGKLNMSPMALGSSTHNQDFGHCYNPLQPSYSAGGSSGGSAAAVAAGAVAIALGTDTLGSVRIPAAFCGIVGFKPSWESISTQGVLPLCRMLDHVGVLCRSVEDARQVFNVLRSSNRVVSHSVIEPASCVLGVVSNAKNIALQPDVHSAYESASKSIEALGFEIRNIDTSQWQLTQVRRAALLLAEAELLHSIEDTYKNHRDKLPDDLRTMLDFINEQPTAKLGRALARFGEAKQLFVAALDGIDALVLPTCSHTAFDMSEAPPVDTADLTLIANVLGEAAISLPLPGKSILPVGLQLIACNRDDGWLLNLAGQVEALLTELSKGHDD